MKVELKLNRNGSDMTLPPKISSACITARKVLQLSCGQESVDWAISLLEQGFEGEHLEMLAGKIPPHNHFEIASLRDRVLEEQGIEIPSDSSAITNYAAEILEGALDKQIELEMALGMVAQLYIAANYPRNLQDFYLQYCAYIDLQTEEFQYYWPKATKENIRRIIEKLALDFVKSSKFTG